MPIRLGPDGKRILDGEQSIAVGKPKTAEVRGFNARGTRTGKPVMSVLFDLRELR